MFVFLWEKSRNGHLNVFMLFLDENANYKS